MSAHSAPTNVLIAGGGVAALETALALQALTDEGVDVELLAPEPAFWHRPPAVAEPFGLADVRHFPLPELAASAGATFTLGALASVDAERRLACTSAGMVIPFDVLVIATGALPEPAVPGAVTFRGPADCEQIDALLAEVASKGARRVAFVIPAGASWSLLAYELALLTADWASARAIFGLEVVVVTPEERPLAILGRDASAAVEALLARHAVRLLTDTRAVAVRDRELVLLQDEPLYADWVIAAPRLRGQDIGGLPQNAHGFVRVDEHGRITELDGVYAAGDVTTFPLKHAGIAAEQADAVAEAIAEAAGGDLVALPFRPNIDGVSKAIIEPPWSSIGKVAGKYLGPFLERPVARTITRRSWARALAAFATYSAGQVTRERMPTTPGTRSTNRVTSPADSASATSPSIVTSPASTAIRSRSGVFQSVRRITSSRISRSIASSSRAKARTRSARVTMPTSLPCLSTTGSLFTQRSSINAAASEIARSGRIVTAGAVIASAASRASCLYTSLLTSKRWSSSEPWPFARRAFLDQDVALGDDAQHGAVVINDRHP